MFDGFTLTRRAGDQAGLHVRYGGDGPPVLLLHGHPRTHATWHRAAPLLVAAGHTVVCPDLRGPGESSEPPTDQEHRPYSKRAMAGGCLALTRGLGHARFAVVGHDRGAYVATRLALDHPEAVFSALSVLDASPSARHCAGATRSSPRAGGTGSSSRRPTSRPNGSSARTRTPGTGAHPSRWASRRTRTTAAPSTIRPPCTSCARTTGPGIDRRHDDADRRAGRRVECPLQVRWATRDDMVDLYGDVLEVWRDWAGGRLEGRSVESGHHNRRGGARGTRRRAARVLEGCEGPA